MSLKSDLNIAASQVNTYLLESAILLMKAAAEKGFYECDIRFKEDLDMKTETEEDRLKVLAVVEMLYQEGIQVSFHYPDTLVYPVTIPTALTVKWYYR